MSESETGMMMSREPFTVGIQKFQMPSQQSGGGIHNMGMDYNAEGASVYKNVGAGGGGGNTADAGNMADNLNMPVGESVKRKRGRPRKYSAADGAMASSLSPGAAAAVAVTQSGGGFSPPSVPLEGSAASPFAFSTKKARGRPPGSRKKQQLESLGSAGVGFTPHVITVKAGEDVAQKIMSFSQNSPRTVCILSASGTISNVTLRQTATSGGTATYEGRFDILKLSGSFMLTEVGGQRSRTGGLSVSLAGPDGRVLGGCVAGLLTAASLVQVILGSFAAADGSKDTSAPVKQLNPGVVVPPAAAAAAVAGGSPSSRGTLSESSDGPGSPLNHSSGACNNRNTLGMSGVPWK